MPQTVERASMDAKNLDHEHRLLMPDGSIKHVHVLAQPFNDQCGNVEFVGTLMDVTFAAMSTPTQRTPSRSSGDIQIRRAASAVTLSLPHATSSSQIVIVMR
jgi:hypothetical protein